jgi:hypothetical protein
MDIFELGLGILVVSSSDHESIPERLQHGGLGYKRFMDRLFLPCGTEDLNVDQIKVINRFREVTFRSDAQFSLNLSVKNRVATALTAIDCRSIIEIGCGQFPITNLVPTTTRYAAIEIDEVAISGNRAVGIDCVSFETLISDFIRMDFDAFVSLFVFQFNVTPALTAALHERTHSGGMGIVNLYAVEPELRGKRIAMFESSGFNVTSVLDIHPQLRRNEFLVLSKRTVEQERDRIEAIRKALAAIAPKSK